MNSLERTVVSQGFDRLKPFVAAFVEQHLGPAGRTRARRDGRQEGADTQALLRAILDNWEPVFRAVLPGVARTYVHELRDVRNRWAHEEPFTRAEADRAIDTMRQLAAAIGVPLSITIPTAARRSTLPSERPSRGLGRKPSQRDIMRAIYAKCGGDPERAVRYYAEAERRGEVRRIRNGAGLSPEAYARALLLDGERKGWLAKA